MRPKRRRVTGQHLSTVTVCWCDECDAPLLGANHAEQHAALSGHTVLVQRQETTIYETRKR